MKLHFYDLDASKSFAAQFTIYSTQLQQQICNET